MRRVSDCHPERPNYCGGLCKACHQARWRAENPEKYKATYMKYNQSQRAKAQNDKATAKVRLSRSNCPPELYDRLNVEQNYLCAICRKPDPRNRALSADHDHKTGEMRGLLCSRCNLGVGVLGDSLEDLLAAVKYLNQGGAVLLESKEDDFDLQAMGLFEIGCDQYFKKQLGVK